MKSMRQEKSMSDKSQPEPAISKQEEMEIRRALDRFVEATENPLSLWIALFDQIRHGCSGDPARIAAKYSLFLTLLAEESSYREAVRERIIDLFEGLSQVSFYTDAGILPNTGFFSELWRRIVHRILPDVPNLRLMQDAIATIFHGEKDYLWLVPSRNRKTSLWHLIRPMETPRKETLWKTLDQLLEALQVLGIRIASLGVDPELLRIMPELARHGSPFLALSAESQRFVDAYRASITDDATVPQNERHLLVLIQQCEEATERAGKKASQLGTSLRLTYILVRLGQSLRRFTLLGELLGSRMSDRDETEITDLWVGFFRDALVGLSRRNSIRSHIASLIGLLALRVTENASIKGEHYIAANRQEYRLMFRSAAGAGLLIGAMALLKALGAKVQLAPILQALLYSVIYAVCFVAAYMLHFTIATKQPAMTAATLAANLGSVKPGRRKWDDVVALTVNTARSQIAAIAGNVFVAFPTALAVLLACNFFASHSLLSSEKAGHLLHDLHPFQSLALIHAAIAGFYLFLSGLITGYFDNRAVYMRIGERIATLRWLRSLTGPARADRIGVYIHDHLGGLMGNTLFGVMLGSTGVFGQIIGLPVDIRHIAFSAANLAYALVTIKFQLPLAVFMWSFLGVCLIGMVNLIVSFSLALWTALKSRGIRDVPFLEIFRVLWQKFLAEPRSFFRVPEEQP